MESGGGRDRLPIIPVVVFVLLFVFIVVEYQQIADLRSDVSNLNAKNDELSKKVVDLTKVIEQQTDQLNRLRLPEVVRKKLGVSDLLVDNAAGPLIQDIKNKAGPLSPAVDAASGLIKTIIRAKLSSPSVQVSTATRIAGSIYSTNLVLSVPVKLSEIPLLSSVQNAIGDVTVNINVNLIAEVDVATETVSNVQFAGVSVG